MTKKMTPMTGIGSGVYLASASVYPRLRGDRVSGAAQGVHPAA